MNLTNAPQTTDALSDREWIKNALDSFASVEPKEKGIDYIRSREAWARKLVSEISASRIPRLIVALFDSYDGRKEDAFSEMMWLIDALYSSLPQKVNHDDACAILSATRHSCGHGGVVEPVNLAKVSFSDSPYTPELFRAMRTYRDRLAGISSSTVTDVRGEIAIILWQDPQEPLRPGNCLSAGIREDYFAAENFRRERWGRLLRHTDHTARRRPDKKWVREAGLALNVFGKDTFTQDLAEWLKIPDGRVPLSTGGRHVLKTLIWYSALAETDRLDHLLPGLIDLQYAKPEAAVHLIYAIGYWLESRPKEFADEHRKRLREKWPIAGSRIRG